MGAKTAIEWTDATWNPIRGCSRVSEGCRHCYAEAVARRFSGHGMAYEGLAVLNHGRSSWTGKVAFVEEHLLDPLRWRKPRRIFVNSMSDLFHERVPDAWIDRIFAVMAMSPRHTFQILTKRPKRMLEYLTRFSLVLEWADHLSKLSAEDLATFCEDADCRIFNAIEGSCGDGYNVGWPMRNVWLGVSVENQTAADERIPLLLKTPGAARFISAEPLLGPVDLEDVHYQDEDVECLWKTLTAYHEVLNSNSMDIVATADDGVTKLDWVICGGESGPGARPMSLQWARGLRDQCQAAGVPYFFKQWGEWAPTSDLKVAAARGLALNDCMSHVGKKAAGAVLDGREWKEFPR
jgi:protein gp37